MKRSYWVLAMSVFIVLLAAFGVFFTQAHADTLTAVSPPFDWTAILIAVAIGGAVVGIIWYFRNNPGSVATAQSETSVLKNDLASMASKAMAALHTLTQTHAAVVTAAVMVPASPASAGIPASSVPMLVYPDLATFMMFVNAYSGQVMLDGTIEKTGPLPGVSYVSSVKGIVRSV